jgi:NAD(P)H-nitrite reductase large subunit
MGGYGERVVLIGEDAQGPYDRTTLSKSVLAGEATDPPPLAPPGWYDEARVELITNRRVTGIDSAATAIRLDDGQSLKFEHLVIATGASARKPPIPGADSERVFLLRSVSDARRLQSALGQAHRIAIIGGGLIGCEVASTVRKLGLEVVLIESADELLQRVLGPQIGRWGREALMGIGVACQTGRQVMSLRDRPDGITVRCAGGTDIDADLVLICVGAVPNDGLAREAGMRCGGGVQVDAAGRTSAPHVYAAGDAASWPLREGTQRSLETYLNSQEQGEAVAKAILGQPVEALQESRSWTEIAGHRIQVVGDFVTAGSFLRRGDLASNRALIFRIKEGRVAAALGVNLPKDFAIATRLVDQRVTASPEQLIDPAIPLRSLLPAR